MEKEIVLKQNVVPLFNCLICKKLFDHPTNITECNHIFCRRCIEDKFTVENLKACPVCNVDLGVDPLERIIFKTNRTWEQIMDLIVRPNRSRRHLILIITSGLIPTTRTDQTSPHVFNRSNFSSSSRHYTDKENTREHGEVSYHLRSPSSDFTEHEASGPAQHLRTNNDCSSNSVDVNGFGTVTSFSGKRNRGGYGLVRGLIRYQGNGSISSSKQLISSRSHARSSSSPNAMTTELRLGKISRVAHHNNLGKAIELRSLRSSTRHTDLGSSSVNVYFRHKFKLNLLFIRHEFAIWLREETVRSTQKLHELVDWWVQTTPVAERKSGMVGRSAAGFVMKLHYSGSYFTSLNNSAGHLSSSNH
ncbi:unnamed protein product [Brassica oleracea]